MREADKQVNFETCQNSAVKQLNRSSRWEKSLCGGIALAAAITLIVACGAPYATEQTAKTSYILLDVTSASGQSGKFTNEKTAESFWLNPRDGTQLRCFNSNGSFLGIGGATQEARDCKPFPAPKGLPPKSLLLAINMGTDQVTQSVWDTGDQEMATCEHGTTTVFGGDIGEGTNCRQFPKAAEVNPKARLESINSGQGTIAQSFWSNPDGTYTECAHEKSGTSLFGLGAKLLGKITSCGPLVVPTNKMPKSITSPKLAAVTSDQNRPMETFWQDANSTLVRCEHDKEGGFIGLGDRSLGNVKSCGYWPAPQIR